MKVFVVLPTYNEAENIEGIVKRVMNLDDINLIIVDDNSPDGTGQLADRLSTLYDKRIYVMHRDERGRGSAGISGFKFALRNGAELVIEMDADFSHPPELIPKLVAGASQYDVVIASKYAEGGGSNEDSMVRRLISKGANFMAKLFLGRGISDWIGGFKCYRAAALASLDFDRFLSKGYSIGVETLFRLLKKGFTFTEVPFIFVKRARGSSKFNVKEMWSFISVVVKLKYLDLRGEL